MSLQSELERLFGKRIIKKAGRLSPSGVDALVVKEAAGALLRLKGRPTEQAAFVRAMKPKTAAALCRWLGDSSFWSLVGGITRQ